jgi:hypothetical protein
VVPWDRKQYSGLRRTWRTYNRRIPVLVGDMASANGDASVIRSWSLGPKAGMLFLAEEQSKDARTSHVTEALSILGAR